MSKKAGVVVLIISIIAILLSAAALAVHFLPEKQQKGDTQYVLYLGTNDKDTNQPVFSAEEARKKAEEILINHFGGYTIQDANGGWIDEGKTYQEYTLVIYLSDTNLDAVHLACNDMIREFHQSSVLIQANRTQTEFYNGQ